MIHLPHYLFLEFILVRNTGIPREVLVMNKAIGFLLSLVLLLSTSVSAMADEWRTEGMRDMYVKDEVVCVAGVAFYVRTVYTVARGAVATSMMPMPSDLNLCEPPVVEGLQ